MVSTHEPWIYPHECVTNGCDSTVRYDDEPWCFTHSPDEGSSLEGFSARKMVEGTDEEKRAIHALFRPN